MTDPTQLTRRNALAIAGLTGLVAGTGLAVSGAAQAQAQTKKEKREQRKAEGEARHPKLHDAIDAMKQAKADIEARMPAVRDPEKVKLRKKAITAIEIAIIDLKLIIEGD